MAPKTGQSAHRQKIGQRGGADREQLVPKQRKRPGRAKQAPCVGQETFQQGSSGTGAQLGLRTTQLTGRFWAPDDTERVVAWLSSTLETGPLFLLGPINSFPIFSLGILDTSRAKRPRIVDANAYFNRAGPQILWVQGFSCTQHEFATLLLPIDL